MFKTFDFVCLECESIFEEMLEDGEEFPKCPICSGDVARTWTTFNYKLVYNPAKDIVTWGNENYATSQYWKDYKAARERGEKVMPATELVGKTKKKGD